MSPPAANPGRKREGNMLNKDRFKSERQFEIAMDAIDRAYEKRYGKSGVEDMGRDAYGDFIDNILYASDESAFSGTDEEIAEMWSNPGFE